MPKRRMLAQLFTWIAADDGRIVPDEPGAWVILRYQGEDTGRQVRLVTSADDFDAYLERIADSAACVWPGLERCAAAYWLALVHLDEAMLVPAGPPDAVQISGAGLVAHRSVPAAPLRLLPAEYARRLECQ